MTSVTFGMISDIFMTRMKTSTGHHPSIDSVGKDVVPNIYMHKSLFLHLNKYTKYFIKFIKHIKIFYISIRPLINMEITQNKCR